MIIIKVTYLFHFVETANPPAIKLDTAAIKPHPLPPFFLVTEESVMHDKAKVSS